MSTALPVGIKWQSELQRSGPEGQIDSESARDQVNLRDG